MRKINANHMSSTTATSQRKQAAGMSVLASRALAAAVLASLAFTNIFPMTAAASEPAAEGDKVILRVCNWEEYIDEGEWDEEEIIDLESGDIFGENSVVDDFEEWYEETYGVEVEVEYSTFGTNEDLYNMLTLGDKYDIVCPSEYMIMKLMAEDQVQPLSDDFFNEEDENNYYIKGVSPYIRRMFQENEINGTPWEKCAAGYMWGITGFVYNPDVVDEETASTYHILENTDFRRQITIKDNVRDSYFMAVGALKSDLLTDEAFRNDPDYHERLKAEMNDVSPETIAAIQDYLQDIKDNLYSFETDSGKADMITGKVVANYQWSGDAVYTMDQAEEDDYYLNFAVPEESTNIYFDGWCMLKAGIEEDPAKQHAAEAWINFCSRPDIVVRNMYYIGYTSVISGGDDDRVFEYLDWTYGAEEDEEDVVEYDLSWFFADAADTFDASYDVEEADEAEEEADGAGVEESADEENEIGDYVIIAPEEQTHRQLLAQYPDQETIARTSIMVYFDAEANAAINQMWINIRCYNIKDVPAWIWGLTVVVLIGLAVVWYKSKKQLAD